MIISFRHRYVFVHIPKTGGTSLSLALEEKLGKDDFSVGDTPKARNRRKRLQGVKSTGRIWKHSTLKDIPGLIDEATLDQMRVFTIVRNPWDRMVSYYHWLQAQRFDHPVVALSKSLDFSAFLHDPQVGKSFRCSPYPSYVTRTNGREHCDLYLRLEHLKEDVGQLETLLDTRIGPVPHTNQSERGPYQKIYSDADAEKVAQISASDIARFGYRF